MHLSTRTRYGLRVMVDLAIYHGRGPVAAKCIAGRQQISRSYVDQLLFRLRRASLVKSVRGPGGGFLLSRPPDEITALDVVGSLEDTVSPVFCVDVEGSGERCARSEHCPTRRLWMRLRDRIEQILRDTTLADLRASTLELARESGIDHDYTFEI